MMAQNISRLVLKLDNVMADAGYARVETTAPGTRDSAQLPEMTATVHPHLRSSVERLRGTRAGRRARVYSYRDGGTLQRPS